VKTPFAPVKSVAECFGPADVPFNALEARAFQATHVASRPKEAFDLMSPHNQLVDEVGADESGCASDETVHEYYVSTPWGNFGAGEIKFEPEEVRNPKAEARKSWQTATRPKSEIRIRKIKFSASIGHEQWAFGRATKRGDAPQSKRWREIRSSLERNKPQG
jgi:hypothetical protein